MVESAMQARQTLELSQFRQYWRVILQSWQTLGDALVSTPSVGSLQVAQEVYEVHVEQFGIKLLQS